MTPPPNAPRRTILVVDDCLNNRILVDAVLKADGYRVLQAEDGKTALEAIRKEKPDVLLLDLMMPEMDGHEVVRRLRADNGIGHLPILLLTALGEAESKAQAQSMGVDDYCPKPFTPKLLRAKVGSLLQNS